jgi:23S rRNA (guanosine2251-2'-O)-methyltransferase
MKEWIFGRNPVNETILAGRRQVFRLRVARESITHPRLDRLTQYAASRNIPVEPVPREQLDPLADHHQGVAVQVSSYPYSSLENILSVADDRGEPPLVLLLDTLQDPQNLGTLLRTAEIVGVQGILLPKRHSASVTPAVVNASSGATEHLLIAQTNLAQAINRLKQAGLWVIGLEAGSQAQSPDELNLDGPLGLVIGSEGKGMRPLVRRSCDLLMRLPMRGKIDSLNAAVAGSIALYLVWQARGYSGSDAAKETIDEPGKS